MSKSPKQIAQEAQHLAAQKGFVTSEIPFDPASVANGATALGFAKSIGDGHGAAADAVSLLESLARVYHLGVVGVLIQFASALSAISGNAGDMQAIGIALGKLVLTGQSSTQQVVQAVVNALVASKLPNAQQAGAILIDAGGAPTIALDIGNLVPQSLSADAAVGLLLALVKAAGSERAAWEAFGSAAGAQTMALFKAGKITLLQSAVDALTAGSDVADGALVLNAMVKNGAAPDQITGFVLLSSLLPFQFIGGLAVNLTNAQQILIAQQIVPALKSGPSIVANAANDILFGASTYPQGASPGTAPPGMMSGLNFLFVLAVAIGDNAPAHVAIGSAIGTALANHGLPEWFPQMQDAIEGQPPLGIGLPFDTAIRLLCGAAGVTGVSADTQYMTGGQIGRIVQLWSLDYQAIVGFIDSLAGFGPASSGTIDGITALNLLLGLGNRLGWSSDVQTAVGNGIGTLIKANLLATYDASTALTAAVGKQITDLICITLIEVSGAGVIV